MKRKLMSTVALVIMTTTSVHAGDDCDVDIDRWQPREAVRAMAVEQGWSITRIKIEDGCYEVHGFDREGRRFEAKIDPETLQVVELEKRHDHKN